MPQLQVIVCRERKHQQKH